MTEHESVRKVGAIRVENIGCIKIIECCFNHIIIKVIFRLKFYYI